jgi:hypothetical protein
MAAAPEPRAAIVAFFRAYAPVRPTGPFSCGSTPGRGSSPAGHPGDVDPPQLAWQRLLEDTIAAGVTAGRSVATTGGAAWRIMSVVDGLALQVVANATTIRRADVGSWSAVVAERTRTHARSPGIEERPITPPTFVAVRRRRASAEPTGPPIDDASVDPAAPPPAPSVHLRA